ncbi:hypothetical protein ISF_09360 [Cordyceps fumosorosea ARSEF 2679]|uniref:Uncharacterized protein n=1 Tax=Cordyceps fumosorosea (strain ARSEF 2679) TaxID=1081104 RepID=A0A162M405_CORFA|nr:hypothetical protein ISF_09360 [Cordyceps fumosorosea ARSEF 2679]OAA50230.1 hypothetical protein ISF_09360 [Cordyceps fumosorosea ARSEF 2679]
MAPANTRARPFGSQRLTRKNYTNSEPDEPKSNESANPERENLSGPMEICIIADNDDSSDDDGSAQMNSDNSDSLRSKELIPNAKSSCRLQSGGHETMDDSATYARTAYDLNGKTPFVGNEQLQARNAGHPILTPGGTSEIPDSEGPDDEDPGSTQTRNAETNADTNADTNEGTNADRHADPAPYNGANTSRRGKISRKRNVSPRTGGKRDAPVLRKIAKRRKVFKDLSQESSPFLLSGAEILSIIPRGECIEIEVDGCWRMQFVDKPLSSTTYRGSYTVRVTPHYRSERQKSLVVTALTDATSNSGGLPPNGISTIGLQQKLIAQ